MRRDSKPKVSFYLRSTEQKEVKTPIMLRVSYMGNRKNFGHGVAYNEEKVDRGFLDENELAELMKTDIGAKHLDFTRDAFVFSCFTGLVYCDVAQLTKNNIYQCLAIGY